MSQYTPAWSLVWLARGPRGWLLVLLLFSFAALPCGAPQIQQQLDWVPPREPYAGWLRLRPSRLGGWWLRASRIVGHSVGPLVTRTALMLVLTQASGLQGYGVEGWPWVALPVADWGLHTLGALWPALWTRPAYQDWALGLHRLYQWSVWSGAALAVGRWACQGQAGAPLLLSIAPAATVVCTRAGNRVELTARPGPDGRTTYHVRLQGEFVYELTPRDAMEQRLLLLDLRRLRTPGREHSQRGIVRQEALAHVFHVTQEEISRWQRYVREGCWAQLLSLQPKSLLSDELQQQIVTVWAQDLWQSAVRVRQRLADRGVPVALRVVEEAGRQSGLMTLREVLQAQWVHSPQGLRPRDTYVTEQLFLLVDQLQAQRAAGQSAPREETVDVTTLRQLAGVAAGPPTPEKRLEKPWPWLFQVEHWLFQAWEPVDDGSVRCLYCGSAQVARKSRQPRQKVYQDGQGQRQTVAVYRYYCLNPECNYGSFTNLPPGVLPYSCWPLDARLRAVELYAGLRTTYRGAAVALGVAPSTLYQWLAQFGGGALPIAAWFGLVRSSGVVGIDEKYVKVPKNDKPDSPQRKWMYVYVAVDAHTLDLLHLAIFPHLGTDSARTFLLGLRAKGYTPRVILTDLCADYPDALAAVFPHAVHHECVFHALQYWHRHLKTVFGRDYAAYRADLDQLRHELDRVFKAKTRRTVQKRYDQWSARRATWLQTEPRLLPLFDSVARHFPRLINAYDQPLIPLTNNATERLIRRFDQHYQNFAGFDSIETARCYLHLFELTYRFTPFGPEVQPHLRGKCPLELAGYDLSGVPFARYLREHSLRPLIPDGLPPAEVVPR